MDLSSKSTGEKGSPDYECVEVTEEFVQSIFEKHDTNDDGLIEHKELTIQLQTDHNISPTVVQALIEHYDENKDAKVDVGEFKTIMSKHKALFEKYLDSYMNLFEIPAEDGTTKLMLQKSRSWTGRYEDLVTMKSTTVGMIFLSLIQIVIFFTKWKDWLIFNHNHRIQIWRYLTYMFTHNSGSHLAINVIIQLFAGLPLEMVNGWRVLIIYLAGVLGGCMVQSVIYPYENLAGGSPGVYAVLTAHISKILLNYREISSSVPQLVTLCIFTALNTVYNYFTYWNYDGISYISHLGGAGCGLLIGILILKNIRKKYHEVVMWHVTLGLYVGLMLSLFCLDLTLSLLRYGRNV